MGVPLDSLYISLRNCLLLAFGQNCHCHWVLIWNKYLNLSVSRDHKIWILFMINGVMSSISFNDPLLDDELRGNKDIWFLMNFKYSLNSVVRSWFFQKFSKVVFLMNHYTLYIYYDIFWNVFWCLRLCSGTGYDCQGNSSLCEGTFLSSKS